MARSPEAPGQRKRLNGASNQESLHDPVFAVYGFRVGEVCRLRLENVDWANEKISVRRFKQGKIQTYPLTTEVGNALLRYLEDVRPKSTQREIFLTLRQPYRPVSTGATSSMVQKQQKRLGVRPKHFGPHALRHACATKLLAEGLTLKEVGDHLGHVSVAATRAYAKVDLPGSEGSRGIRCETTG